MQPVRLWNLRRPDACIADAEGYHSLTVTTGPDHALGGTKYAPDGNTRRVCNVDFWSTRTSLVTSSPGFTLHHTYSSKMSQQFELDFDFGSPEPAAPSPPAAPADSGATSPARSPAAEALNGVSKPAPAPMEEDDVPDEDELLAMMEQDARENMARDVENLEALKRKEDEKKAAAARRRAAIMAALGGEPLQDITNTPAQTQAAQKESSAQPTQTQRNGESSTFEADFDFGEPAVASCKSSSPSSASFGVFPGTFQRRASPVLFSVPCSSRESHSYQPLLG